MRILHVTDFHIDSDYEEKSNLRPKYYKEFIKKLCKAIDAKNLLPIDYLMITGDFVNFGKTKNFKLSQDIVESLASQLGITHDRIGLCMGNHDYDIKLDAKKEQQKARTDYSIFAKNFGFGKLLKSNDRASLYISTCEDLYLLSFDSTYDSFGSNKPGKISQNETDEIVHDWLMEEVPNNKLLIILSHYPMMVFSRATFIAEEPKWVEEHYWGESQPLVERIIEYRDVNHTLWLFGDGHIPDFVSVPEEDPKHHFLMTGMFGGNVMDAKYNKTDEVKLIEFPESNKSPTIYTFNYKNTGFNKTVSGGKWDVNESSIRIQQNPTKKAKSKSSNQVTQVSQVVPPLHYSQIEMISESVEKSIIDRIEKHGLYTLGRHSTSDSAVSLGWIPIDKLFTNEKILVQCIDKAAKWIEDNSTKDEIVNGTIVCVGIDFWGGILASNVALRIGASCHIITNRSKGKHNTTEETCEHVAKILSKDKSISSVILFTDVISSGESITTVHGKLSSVLKIKPKWFSVSIIADTSQTREFALSCFNKIGSFCINLKIPIIKNDSLPNESILPARFDLR